MGIQEIIIGIIVAGCLFYVARRIYHIISASKRNESVCGCCSCGCGQRKKECPLPEEAENKSKKGEKSCVK